MMRNGSLSLLAMGLVVSSSLHAAPPEVGAVEFAKGQVSAQHPGTGDRSLDKNSGIYAQDLVETGDKSFSILKFLDDGKVTVRPLSRFRVSTYNVSSNQAAFRLEQGAVTVETSDVGRDRPQQMVVDTPLARVNAQQAVVQIRVCDERCADEAAASRRAKTDVSADVVARVIKRKGNVSAQSPGGALRKLAVGAPLYQADRLSSGNTGQLLAVFRDGGRISLGANSEMNIEKYHYGQGGGDRSSLQLVKGSLRALTGRLGKQSPEDYAIKTPVAIIGVRGTAMDLLYPADRAGRLGGGTGLLSHVRQGGIRQRNAAGSFDLGTRRINFIASNQEAPRSMPTPPRAMLRALGLKPESARIDMEQLFGVQKLSGVPSGVYIYAGAGHVKLTGKIGRYKGTSLELGRKEAAYVDENGRMTRLERPMPFQLNDLPVAGGALDRPDMQFVPPLDAVSMPFDDHLHNYIPPVLPINPPHFPPSQP
jgi:hypothetical protein